VRYADGAARGPVTDHAARQVDGVVVVALWRFVERSPGFRAFGVRVEVAMVMVLMVAVVVVTVMMVAVMPLAVGVVSGRERGEVDVGGGRAGPAFPARGSVAVVLKRLRQQHLHDQRQA
jgi:hypothetical protein